MTEKLAVAQVALTPEQQVIQASRDKWEKENPGKSYLTPEGPTLGPEDISRLEAAAEAYGFDKYDRQNIAEVYSGIRGVGVKREEELRGKYAADEYQTPAIEDLIRQKQNLAMEQERQRFIEESLPYPPDAKGRHKKRIDKQREQLLAMLSRSPDEFNALQTDWQAYEDVLHTNELDRLQGEALGDDKGFKAVEQRTRIKNEMAEINGRNGDVFEYMAQYDVENDPRLAEIIKKYRESISRNSEDEDLTDADKVIAFHDFNWRLGEMIAAKAQAEGAPLSDEAVSRETQAASPYIESWLEAIAESKNDPWADLKEYRQKETAYNSWDNRRRKAVEYLAPMVLLRSVQARLSGENNAEQQEKQSLDPEETIKTILDPGKIGNRNGAKALLHGDELSPTDVELYNKGVRGQLELARNYSRHQNNVLKAALIFNALAVGGYQNVSSNLAAAWDRIPEKDRRTAFKKVTLGKAVTWSVKTRRLARRAAQRAEKNRGQAEVLKSQDLVKEVIAKDK
jgi:hypothetical protein